jgi:hypothetical protein
MTVTAALSPRSSPKVLHRTVSSQKGAGSLVASHDDFQEILGDG